MSELSYKLTLDGGLKNAVPPLPAITTLKAWEAEGKVEIFEADRVKEAVTQGWPGQTPTSVIGRPWGGRGRPAPKKNAASTSAFNQMSSVLFPHRDVHKLDMAQLNDVSHLIRHQTLGNSIFVTCNTRDFIEQGKREKLQATFKIVVMTPDEVVSQLRETEGWTSSKKAP